MMYSHKEIILPEALLAYEQANAIVPECFFLNYKAFIESEKNKITFSKHIFNFVLSGQKMVHTLDEVYQIGNHQCLIVRKGKCLTSEKYPENGVFSSLTFYFDPIHVQNIITKYSKYLSQVALKSNAENKDVFVFEKDTYIESFIKSVQLLMKNDTSYVPVELSLIKLEELLLYLIHKHGNAFYAFLKGLSDDFRELDFIMKMQSESLNKLTLEEMAFLSNMSLSTFKRTFSNAFGISPQKWFQNQRLQFAYNLLKSNTKTPSDLYLELGYSSLSSFSVAFAKEFGIPPTKVQQLKNELS